MILGKSTNERQHEMVVIDHMNRDIVILEESRAMIPKTERDFQNFKQSSISIKLSAMSSKRRGPHFSTNRFSIEWYDFGYCQG